MNSAELVKLLDPDWSAASPGTGPRRNLSRRAALALRTLITSGLLPPGATLPSERSLASAMSVSRPTITSAMDELRSQGLVESRQGSGTWVAEGRSVSSSVPTMAEVVLVDRGINLAAATPGDASHLGPLSLDMGDLLSVSPGHGYDPSGLVELRTAIANHLARRGGDPSPSEIIVTPGAHSALSLCIGTLVERGDRVIVAEHTYGGALDLISVARAKAVTVRRDRWGIEPDGLDRALRRHQPSMIYLMPTVHAPTGTTTSDARLREIAEVLDRHGVPVVADEALADLAIRPTCPRLATACHRAPVIELGTLSKLAWGGLRIGWLVPPVQLRRRLAHRRSQVEIGTSMPSQVLAMDVFKRLDGIVAQRRQALTMSERHLRGLLSTQLPRWEVDQPDGGLCHWVRLPLGDSLPFVETAARCGVAVMAGAMASPGDRSDSHVRICFDRTRSEITEGVARLESAWRAHTGADGG